MFYDVKILNPQGKIKKIILGQELSARHWKSFYNTEANKTLNSSGNKQVPKRVKMKMDMEYVPLRDASIPA